MNQLIDSITGMLGSTAIDQISSALGGTTDRHLISDAIGGATPALISGLAGRVAEGAESAASMQQMLGGLDTDFLGDLGSYFGGGNFDVGGGILDSILGGRSDGIVDGIARMVGLDKGIMGMIFKMIAPIIIGAITKQMRGASMDMAGVGGMLTQAKGYYEKTSPDAMGTIDKIAAGDQSILDQLGDMGKTSWAVCSVEVREVLRPSAIAFNRTTSDRAKTEECWTAVPRINSEQGRRLLRQAVGAQQDEQCPDRQKRFRASPVSQSASPLACAPSTRA